MTESFTGFLALLAFVLLPGIYVLRTECSLERIGTAFAVSIGLNSSVIMIAAMNGFYTGKFFWIWNLLLVPVTIWLTLQSHKLGNQTRTSTGIVQWILFPFFVCVGYKAWFLPYFTWDAIASWNRWARNFALDPQYFENSNFFYPQFMSWGMSVPYIGSGSPFLEYISHGYSFFLVLVLFAGTARLARAVNTNALLAFTLLFITYPFVSFVSTGYADIGTAGFTAFALALTLESFKTDNPRYVSFGRSRLAFNQAFFAGLAAGVAFLFKQSSTPVIFALCGSFLLFFCSEPLKEKLKFSILYGTGFSILVLPWIISGSTTLSGTHFLYLISGIHPDPSIGGVLQSGLNMLVRQISALNTTTGGWISLFLIALFMVFAFRNGSRHKALVLSVIVCTLFWMGTASYDARALMPVMVPGSVLVSAGLEYLLRKHRQIKIFLVPVITLICVTFFLTNQFFPTFRLGKERIWEWKQGELWTRIPFGADRANQLRILQPTLAEFEDWKNSRPPITGTVWSDHMLFPSVDPFRIDGGGRWLEEIEGNGKINWQRGDFLVISKTQAQARKLPHPLTDGRLQLVQPIWEDWLSRALETGLIGMESESPNLRIYRFK